MSCFYSSEIVSILQVSSQIPVTYIDESDFPEASLIILTAGSSEGMEEQIIVNRVSWMSLITLGEFVNPFCLTH
jgi:hypothetical protein